MEKYREQCMFSRSIEVGQWLGLNLCLRVKVSHNNGESVTVIRGSGSFLKEKRVPEWKG